MLPNSPRDYFWITVTLRALTSCGGAPQPGAVITPDVPPASQVSFEIESATDRLPISPFIYGINFFLLFFL